MLTDLRFSFRQLRRHPGFALAAIATLAVGIGATTAIFSTVNAAVLRPLPFRILKICSRSTRRRPTAASRRASCPASRCSRLLDPTCRS